MAGTNPEAPTPVTESRTSPLGHKWVRSGAIVIATTLTLSSCIDTRAAPRPRPTAPPGNQVEAHPDEVTPPDIAPPNGPTSPPVKSDYPTAQRVVGRPKLIISPYTGNYIDVEGLAPGSLAMDPTFPPVAKKYFVIPPVAE